jgi:hypothetical protein
MFDETLGIYSQRPLYFSPSWLILQGFREVPRESGQELFNRVKHSGTTYFKIRKTAFCPHSVFVCYVLFLTVNISVPLNSKPVGLCSRDVMCFVWGTNWISIFCSCELQPSSWPVWRRGQYLHRRPACHTRRQKGKSRIWDSKIWSRVPRDSDPRMNALAGASSNCKWQTHPLVRKDVV